MSGDSTISPELRDRLQQLFTRGNGEMLKGNHEYADDIYFTECVLKDPGNAIFFQTFLANLKKKYGTKKKAGGSLLAAGKRAVARTPDAVFKSAIADIKANPWNVDALLAGGKACEDLGFHEAGIEYFRAAVDSEPTHVAANTICCEALREIADYDGALACVKRILEKNPKDIETLRLFNNISAEKTIHRGKYMDNKQSREAAAGENEEDDEDSGEGDAEHQDVMGRPLTYEEKIERRIKRNPQDIANYSELAQLYYKNADFAKAAEWYGKGMALPHSTPEITEHFLDSQRQHLHIEALRLKAAYEQQPSDAAKKAFLLKREEHDAKNLELALYRVKQYPNHAGYRYNYGILLQKAGQIKEAIAEFQLAKSESSRRGESLLSLGQCFQMIKQNKLAMQHYHEATQVLADVESKKKALYLAAKLSMQLEDYVKADDYGHQLAAIDFSYRDIGDLLEQISGKTA